MEDGYSRIVFDKSLNRFVRGGSLTDLGSDSWDLLKKAITMDNREAIDTTVSFLRAEGKTLHDVCNDWLYASLTYVAKTFGEEELPKMLRFCGKIVGRTSVVQVKKLSVEQRLANYVEFMRAHRSGPSEQGIVDIWEEKERLVVKCDPCGSGGRMWRGGENGTASRINPPFNLGVTAKPYPWTWSRSGVPYYCAHCCVWDEIMPIEAGGYPLRITDAPCSPDDPCYIFFYKDPADIPDTYYERIGLTKKV